MKLLKRILAVIMMVLSVLVIIVLAAGIVENWIANKTLTNASVRVLSGVDTVLGRTEQALTRLKIPAEIKARILETQDIKILAKNLEEWLK